MSAPAHVPSPWRLQVTALGLVTIGSYGLVLYGFGAFVGSIHDDTGWSNGTVTLGYSLATLAGSIAALGTGRALDRVGARPVLSVTLVAGAALLVLASTVDTAWHFAVAWGAGGAIVVAGLFYSTTMAVTARVADPGARARAYTWLTVIGGLAAPIGFPLTGSFIEAWGWRAAVRAMVAVMVLLTLPALVLVRRDGTQAREVVDDDGFDGVSAALAAGDVRRWLVASSLALAGLVAVQVHHVAAIEATGVTVGVASSLAGIRGLLSLPGRAAAATVTQRIGTVAALRLVYITMAIGTLALVAAGAIAWVWVFVVTTGVAFGSVSPLQGLYAVELYGRRRIGTLMGMQQVIIGTASAAGPFVLGLTVDATGSYTLLLVIAAALQAAAVLIFRTPVRRRA